MLKTKMKYFIALLLIVPLLISSVNAQPESVKQRRLVEHQEIKDF